MTPFLLFSLPSIFLSKWEIRLFKTRQALVLALSCATVFTSSTTLLSDEVHTPEPLHEIADSSCELEKEINTDLGTQDTSETPLVHNTESHIPDANLLNEHAKEEHSEHTNTSSAAENTRLLSLPPTSTRQVPPQKTPITTIRESFLNQKISVIGFNQNSESNSKMRFLHTAFTPVVYIGNEGAFVKGCEISIENNYLSYDGSKKHLCSINAILQLQTPKEIYHLDFLTSVPVEGKQFSYVGFNLYRKTSLFGSTHHIGISPLLSSNPVDKKWRLNPYFSSQPTKLFRSFSMRWGLDYLYRKFYPHLSFFYGTVNHPLQLSLYLASPFFNPSCPFEIAPFISKHNDELWYLDATKYSLEVLYRPISMCKIGCEAGLIQGRYQSTDSFFSPSRRGIEIQSPFLSLSFHLCW